MHGGCTELLNTHKVIWHTQGTTQCHTTLREMQETSKASIQMVTIIDGLYIFIFCFLFLFCLWHMLGFNFSLPNSKKSHFSYCNEICNMTNRSI